MSRYGQHCPVARSLEPLGDRWTLLIIRDVLLGATRFNELSRGLPGMSRGLLSKRLGQLERNRLIEHAGEHYLPTLACEELRPLIFGLAEWGGRWAFGEPRPDELDPTVLMWWVRGRIDPSRFGDKRVVLQVMIPDARRSRFWFVVQAHDVSLCFTDPGFDVDITLEGRLSVLYQVWNGVIEPGRAVRDGLVTLDGRRDLFPLLPAAPGPSSRTEAIWVPAVVLKTKVACQMSRFVVCRVPMVVFQRIVETPPSGGYMTTNDEPDAPP